MRRNLDKLVGLPRDETSGRFIPFSCGYVAEIRESLVFFNETTRGPWSRHGLPTITVMLEHVVLGVVPICVIPQGHLPYPILLCFYPLEDAEERNMPPRSNILCSWLLFGRVGQHLSFQATRHPTKGGTKRRLLKHVQAEPNPVWVPCHPWRVHRLQGFSKSCLGTVDGRAPLRTRWVVSQPL